MQVFKRIALINLAKSNLVGFGEWSVGLAIELVNYLLLLGADSDLVQNA